MSWNYTFDIEEFSNQNNRFYPVSVQTVGGEFAAIYDVDTCNILDGSLEEYSGGYQQETVIELLNRVSNEHNTELETLRQRVVKLEQMVLDADAKHAETREWMFKYQEERNEKEADNARLREALNAILSSWRQSVYPDNEIFIIHSYTYNGTEVEEGRLTGKTICDAHETLLDTPDPAPATPDAEPDSQRYIKEQYSKEYDVIKDTKLNRYLGRNNTMTLNKQAAKLFHWTVDDIQTVITEMNRADDLNAGNT